MPELPDSRQEAGRWIEKADHDLIAAQHTLELQANCPFDVICFHAQQCVEKTLKALLISRSLRFPPTHDLGALFNMLPNDGRPAIELSKLRTLNRYAVEARYPGNWEPIVRDDAAIAVQFAEEFHSLAKKMIS